MAIRSDNLNSQDARTVGYEFERGRYDAQNQPLGEDLANRIQTLLQPVDDLQQTKTIVAELKNGLQAITAQVEKHNKADKAKLVWLPLLVLAVSIAFFRFLDVGPKILAWVFAIGTFAFLWIQRKANEKALKNKSATLQNKYHEAVKHLNWLNQTYDFALIPESYRRHEPMAFFIQVLKSGRALSLHQAITLYEDDKHNKAMYRLQAEQLELQARQVELQRQHLMEDREFYEQQLAQARQNKGIDLKTALIAAGGIVLAVSALKNKRD
ncbi:MAG: hypothetical protein IJ594_05435 [Oscillospiraceae bacterium]|nr:hypothetical protein [Oscillospiraceae bacterium]